MFGRGLRIRKQYPVRDEPEFIYDDNHAVHVEPVAR
jgi:hypothetical protein